MVTLHACIGEHALTPNTVAAIKARLRQRFGLEHVTVEIEHVDCADGHATPSTGSETKADRHSD